MHKKKLVHIISSLKFGGAESLLIDLVANLDAFHHEVIFFHDGPNKERLEQLGIKTYHIKGKLFRYDIFFWWQLWLLLKKIKPDALHSSLWAANFFARIFARLLKMPLVSVIHLGVNRDGVLRNMFDFCTFFLSQKVIAVSQEVAQSVQQRRWINPERITVIPNGIALHNISRSFSGAPETTAIRPCAGFVIGSVGRFIARKNYSFLLEVYAQLLQKSSVATHLMLIGVGPLEADLRKRVRELRIDEHVSFIVGQNAYAYYPLFDCFVLPSLQEGISIALLEAMAFGLPCVVTAHDHEVIEHKKNGLLVAHNDIHGLENALQEIIENKSLAQKLGNNARKTIEQHYTIDNMANAYEKILQKAMRNLEF